jgi:aspartyl-tRNA(Asn)/glutamyl-tRNA(Gln) amidotransferase subunit B
MSSAIFDKYEAVIGLEVHAELLTETKIFSPAPSHFGGDPNTNVSEICLGMPGVLPVLNEGVLTAAIRTGLALNCDIPEVTKFDRKHYFYADLPKGYQISQFDQPICGKGYLDIETPDGIKRVGITRAHMEEDAGKLVHQGAAGLAGSTHSFVDLNRAGVPLLEIVSEPDIKTPEEAKAYMQELRNVLVYLGVNDGRLEQGSLRCDANISVMLKGSKVFGTRAEIKNMNSFNAIERAVRYEINRQIECVEAGERIVQETRLWNDERQMTVSMRSKEGASDYRYFPDPDLLPISVSRELVAELQKTLPELPAAKRERYEKTLGLSSYDARVIVDDVDVAAYFEAAVSIYSGNVKGIANWVMGDIAAYLNQEKLTINEIKPQPKHIAELVQLIDDGTISGKIAKTLMIEMLKDGEAPGVLVDKLGMRQISDTGAIVEAVKAVLAASPTQVADFYAGKTKIMGYLVGQVMKQTQGRAKPELVNELVLAELEANRV